MFCQKCRTPLKLDSTLNNLNPAAYDLLVATSTTPSSRVQDVTRIPTSQERERRALYDKVSKDAGPPIIRRTAPSSRTADMSFIYLTDSQVVPPLGATKTSKQEHNVPPSRTATRKTQDSGDNVDHQLDRSVKLFEILSARSDIDYPVCVECADILVTGLEKKLQENERERAAYASYLKQLQADEPTDEEVKAAEKELRAAEADEAAALQMLEDLERQKAVCDAQLLAVEEEARQLDVEEEGFWRDRNAFTTTLTASQNERDSIQAKYEHDSRLLEKLQRSNVYNDTFCISHDGTFATINSLRLGRLSNNPVDWPEINAAWGHALLLLVTVAEKLEYKFKGYQPVPMGSVSQIIRYDPVPTSASRYGSQRLASAPPPQAPKKHVLELYSSGDMPLGLTFMHRKFDNAMVAFLELVRQLGVFVQQKTSTGNGAAALTLPYRIEGDKIDDISIKLGIAQDDGWTKACKLTLTCCKYLLASTSNINNERVAEERGHTVTADLRT